MHPSRALVVAVVGLALALAPKAALAQREPVLKQINLPHPYYFREMYLPQLTAGVSSLAWSPDSGSLVFSMGGSLWRQRLDSTTCEQLTAGPGYDYQPDVSPDGRWVVFVSYAHDAMELWALDLASKESQQLTHSGAVNLEPRFSPDGKRIAFVSTSYRNRFHIFAADFHEGALSNVERLTGEQRSSLPRYYYSPFDHEISPAWSPDGSELVFVSNRGHIYGTGGFWRMPARTGGEAREIHYEETAWKARPEFSPDGKRLVYASYLGQQWHQLWTIPSLGGDAFPLSYGDFDNLNPRWSPDGRRIAFVSNRAGNTALWLEQTPGGAQSELKIAHRNYLKPMAALSISVTDREGRLTPARISVTGEDGRAYFPDNAWAHADDSFVRSERPFEAHYFHAAAKVTLMVPQEKVEIEVMKGFEYSVEQRSVQLKEVAQRNLIVSLTRLHVPASDNTRWASGDLHVHMNYGGTYRNTPAHLVAQAEAEDLAVVEDLVVNKEQRIPDIAYFSTEPDRASSPSTLLLHGQEFHTSYWGHLGLLSLDHNFLLPGYAGYAGTAAASLFPANANVADWAHQQHALVGYVHPYDALPDPEHDEQLTHELPVDAALGKVDYVEVLGFSDHKSTASVWYRLLNCGLHLPAGAGTDAMANFASLRGPVGLNRVYAQVPKGPLHIASWLDAIKKGRTFATNGPLLGFSMGKQGPGATLTFTSGEHPVPFAAWMRSIVPIDHLQIVCDGEVVRELSLGGSRQSADVADSIPLSHSGWCLLRAWSEKPESPILDLYPYATTSPIYVQVAGSQPKPAADAAYFLAWIDRLQQGVEANQDWNNGEEKAEILKLLSKAREFYAQLAH